MTVYPFKKLFLSEVQAFGGPIDREVTYHREIDSTSTELKRRLETGAGAGTVVAAARQSAGRGRSGRVWHSPPEGNLYISLAVDLGSSPTEVVPFLPLAAGVAACEAIIAAGPVEAMLKWPNDVLVQGKKLAGILCEIPGSMEKGIAMVGLGVNIATKRFPDDLARTAVSLTNLSGHEIVGGDTLVATLAARWVVRLESFTQRIRAGKNREIVEAWRSRSGPFGRRVRVGGIEGITRGLDDSGRLEIVKDNGERTLIAGGIVEDI